MDRFHGFARSATVGFLLLAAGLMLGGCGSMTSGSTVSKFTKNEDPGPPVAVDKAGTYALYYTTDTTPQVRTAVKEGEKVGFEPAGADTYAAVAGEYRKVMDKGVLKAFWKREESK